MNALVLVIVLSLLFVVFRRRKHSKQRHRGKRAKRGGDLFARMMDTRWGSIAPGMVLLVLFLGGIAATGFLMSQS